MDDVSSGTFGSLPCLSMSDMIVRMCCSLMTFNASGLSTNTQWNTSNTPAAMDIDITYQTMIQAHELAYQTMIQAHELREGGVCDLVVVTIRVHCHTFGGFLSFQSVHKPIQAVRCGKLTTVGSIPLDHSS